MKAGVPIVSEEDKKEEKMEIDNSTTSPVITSSDTVTIGNGPSIITTASNTPSPTAITTVSLNDFQNSMLPTATTVLPAVDETNALQSPLGHLVSMRGNGLVGNQFVQARDPYSPPTVLAVPASHPHRSSPLTIVQRVDSPLGSSNISASSPQLMRVVGNTPRHIGNIGQQHTNVRYITTPNRTGSIVPQQHGLNSGTPSLRAVQSMPRILPIATQVRLNFYCLFLLALFRG